MIERLDIVANAQRTRMVGDPVKVFEYQAAEAAALSYSAAGFTGEVPPCVKSWAEARDWTPRAAAEDILAEAAMLRYAFELIREIRLKAKYQIQSCPDDSTAEPIFSGAVNSIKAVGSA